MIKLLASAHARERARERISWHRRTLERMLERVFYDGLGPDDCSRRLHDFIAATTAANPCGLTRIYGEHLFLFTRDLPDEVVLLTVYPSRANSNQPRIKPAASNTPWPRNLTASPPHCPLLATLPSPLPMKPTICAENDSMRFTFADHTAELQSRAGAWFSAHLAGLQEPLRALVAQRLFIHHEGDALRDQLRVEFSLTFQRTLRVPDDGRDYPLPAGLGRLPVRSVRSLKSYSIPEAWRQSPTGIIPLYPAEATWLSFDGSHPFAVQISAGGICAASGLPHVPALSREPQNYLSVPTQPWLDGFRVDAHTVRQFVAIPLGHGYTVEAQMTGQEKRSAVQIRVVPLTVDALWNQHVLPLCEARWKALTRPVGADEDILHSTRLYSIQASCSICEEAGFGAGGRIRQEIYADPLPRESWDESAALACENHLILADRWTAYTGEPMPTPPPTLEHYAAAGIPWFDYASTAAPLTTPSLLAGIKSVGNLFKNKSGMDLPGNSSIAPQPTVPLSGN